MILKAMIFSGFDLVFSQDLLWECLGQFSNPHLSRRLWSHGDGDDDVKVDLITLEILEGEIPTMLRWISKFQIISTWLWWSFDG